MKIEQCYIVEYKCTDYGVERFKDFNDASTRFNELVLDYSYGRASGVFLREAEVRVDEEYNKFEILKIYTTRYALGKEVR